MQVKTIDTPHLTCRAVQLITETHRLGEAPDAALLTQLRGLEVKIGLVLTLVCLSSPSSCKSIGLPYLILVQDIRMGSHQRATCARCFIDLCV